MGEEVSYDEKVTIKDKIIKILKNLNYENVPNNDEKF